MGGSFKFFGRCAAQAVADVMSSVTGAQQAAPLPLRFFASVYLCSSASICGAVSRENQKVQARLPMLRRQMAQLQARLQDVQDGVAGDHAYDGAIRYDRHLIDVFGLHALQDAERGLVWRGA